MDWRPKELNHLDCAMRLLIPTWKTVNGVDVADYPTDGPLFFANFKTYGGTQRDVNGVYTIEDTATVTTWYRPDLKSDCRVVRLKDGAVFEILNEPENVGERQMCLIFKVKRVKGKV